MVSDIVQTISNIGVEHPARQIPFSQIKKGIDAQVNRGNIVFSRHAYYPQLTIYKYSEKCSTENHWNFFTLMANGLIIDTEQEEIVTTPFVKFFNYSKVKNQIDDKESNFLTTEKVKGELATIYHFGNKWRVATPDAFVSECTQWAEDCIHQILPLDKVDKTNTYLCEIIGEQEKELVLLAIIDKFGLEYTYPMLVQEASYLNISSVKKFHFNSLQEVISTSNNDRDFVVKFKDGTRITISNAKNFEEKLKCFIREVEAIYNNTKQMSDKDLGNYMTFHPEAFLGGEFDEAKNYVFMMRKNKFYQEANDPESKMRKKISKL